MTANNDPLKFKVQKLRPNSCHVRKIISGTYPRMDHWRMGCVSAILIAVSVSLVVPSTAKPYKVLVLSPVGSRSIHHVTFRLSEILANSGHLVTRISTFQPSSKHPNITEITTGAPIELLEELNIFHYRMNASGNDWISEVTVKIGHVMWKNERIKSVWKIRQSFNAIVILGIITEIASPFLMDYKGALVTLSSSATAVSHIELASQGNWFPMSAITDNDKGSSFFERLITLWRTWLYYNEYHRSSALAVQEIREHYFPEMPPLEKLYDRSHLTLINGHFALEGPVPLLPTQIEIGPLSAKPAQPLPRDLEEFAESSGDAGVIFFCLGSIVKSRDIPYENKVMFLEVFRKLQQKVIWKYEEDDLDLPPNVLVRKWLPQQDILGHPKTRLFISHCGNSGVQEAKYHGVPILGFPVTFDQIDNAIQVVNKGFGLMISWEDMTQDVLLSSIQTLLTDPSYGAKMKQVSVAIKDQKETAAERALWWVEYAIRCNARNDSHFEYGGRRLHFFQYLMADVIAFWTLVLLLFLSLMCFICACTCRYFFRVKVVQKTLKID